MTMQVVVARHWHEEHTDLGLTMSPAVRVGVNERYQRICSRTSVSWWSQCRETWSKTCDTPITYLKMDIDHRKQMQNIIYFRVNKGGETKEICIQSSKAHQHLHCIRYRTPGLGIESFAVSGLACTSLSLFTCSLSSCMISSSFWTEAGQVADAPMLDTTGMTRRNTCQKSPSPQAVRSSRVYSLKSKDWLSLVQGMVGACDMKQDVPEGVRCRLQKIPRPPLRPLIGYSHPFAARIDHQICSWDHNSRSGVAPKPMRKLRNFPVWVGRYSPPGNARRRR